MDSQPEKAFSYEMPGDQQSLSYDKEVKCCTRKKGCDIITCLYIVFLLLATILVTLLGNTEVEKIECAEHIKVPSYLLRIDSQFRDCSIAKTITFSEGLVFIGDSAFTGTNIETFDLPNSLEEISEYSFYKSNVKHINLASVKIIGSHAFCYTPLEEVVIPSTVKEIGEYAFADAPNLKRVEILTSNIKTISENMFLDCTSLKTVIIEPGIVAIGENAFYNCSNLENIIIPETVSSIEDSSFGKCISLKNIVIPNSVTHIGMSAFESCNNLLSIIISKNITTISDRLCYGCDKLKSIKFLADEVEYIGDSSFCNCNSLVDVIVPGTNIKLGPSSFFGCSELRSISGNFIELQKSAFEGCTSLTKFEVVGTTSVFIVGTDAFSDCSSLESFTILGSNVIINTTAFYYCQNLKVIEAKIIKVSDRAFSHCPSLIKSDLSSVETLSEGLFEWCSSLEEVTLNDNINLIPAWFCYNCESLTSIKIPKNTVSIGRNAFQHCDKLKILDLSENNKLKMIETGSFGYCSELTEVLLPDTVKQIMDVAFIYCTKLRKIVLSKELIKIPKYVFRNCISLEEIEIPDSVISIDGAFSNCLALSSVKINSTASLEKIGTQSFEGCKKLKEIILPKSLTKLESESFLESGIEVVKFRGLKGTVQLEPNSIPENCDIIWNYNGI